MDRKKLVSTVNVMALVVLLGVFGACKKEEAVDTSLVATSDPATNIPAPPPEPETIQADGMATATLQGAPGDTDFKGTITFTPAPEGTGVRVVAQLEGVDTDGSHGFHVHETGDCSHGEGSKHFTSAGSHFNPAGAEHACPPTEPRHAGDLGNIEVKSGTGIVESTTTLLSLSGPNSVVGKAIILHAKADDCKTQPTGDAGDRLACGVVTMGSMETAGTTPPLASEAVPPGGAQQ